MMRDARCALYKKYRRVLLEEPETSWKTARERLNAQANERVLIQLNKNLRKSIESSTNYAIHLFKEYLVDFGEYTLHDLELEYVPIVF